MIVFTSLLAFSWYYAAAIFLLFTGMLLGVGLNAMSNQLGRVVSLPHPVLGWAYHAPRLLFQPVIVWWALFAGGITNWPFSNRKALDQ